MPPDTEIPITRWQRGTHHARWPRSASRCFMRSSRPCNLIDVANSSSQDMTPRGSLIVAPPQLNNQKRFGMTSPLSYHLDLPLTLGDRCYVDQTKFYQSAVEASFPQRWRCEIGFAAMLEKARAR